MNTTKAKFFCALMSLLIVFSTAFAQEKNEDVLMTSSPKRVQPKSNGPDATPTGADVTISSGVTVTLGSGVTMSLGGNFTNNGTVIAQYGSEVAFTSANSETLSGNATTFFDLGKRGGGTLRLNTTATVNGGLLLDGGSIDNTANPLNLASGAHVYRTGGALMNPPTFNGPIDVTYDQSTPIITTGVELPTSSTGLRDLIVNGAGIILGANATPTVNGFLRLLKGNITLGSRNLTLAPGSGLDGGSDTSYVETNETSAVTSKSVDSTSRQFPVGVGGSYNPVWIANDGVVDDFSVSAKATFTVPPAQPNKVVNRQWTITEAVPGGSIAFLSFQWDPSNQASGFNPASPVVIARHNGTQWVETSADMDSSRHRYTAQAELFTSFSPFAVGNTNSLRTVTLANLKFLLEGPFNTGTNLMNTSLRASVLPAQFPGKPIPALAVDSIQIEIRGGITGVLSPIVARATRVEVADAGKEKYAQSEEAVAEGAVAEDAVRSLQQEASRINLDQVKTVGADGDDVADGDPTSPFAANSKTSQPAWLLADGTIRHFTDTTKSYVEFDTTAGSWYVVIRHRNHLAIMTATAQALSSSTPVTAYDFTTAQTQAYGTNPMKPLNGRYCLFAGDADGLGSIDALDRTATWNNRNLTGYLLSDADLSGDVSALDRTITWNNRNLSTQVP
jgi:hypothetical protein